jgi:predicted DCC family thiol-disulfide oxidoreductase YuxK
MARPGALRLVDFQQPGSLDEFPNLDHETCMQAIHLIMPDGKTFRGFEAIVQALATRPFLRWPVQLYYLPGIRQLCELIYRWIARNRYRLVRQAVDRGECPGGACAVHAANTEAES